MALDDISHRIIADLLHTRTGQTLDESRRWRVSTALAGLYREYGISNIEHLVCLLSEPGQHELATQVVEALLNNETYFYRDRTYFDTLANEVLPQLANNRQHSRRIRIWSAGCSTGQEALSLAMVFASQPGRWQGWTIEILGTDISGKAIAQAREGCYSQFEIQRGVGVAQMLDFFTKSPAGWQAQDRIRALTRFQQHNILDPAPSPVRFDLVLCRNLLLYFDLCTRRKAFERLDCALAPDGWLMLGAGETAVGHTHRFEPSDIGAALFRHAVVDTNGRTEHAPLQDIGAASRFLSQ